MAGPGGKEVGKVSIRVLPDTSKFGPALEAYLERMERRLRLDLPVSLNQRDVANAEAELDALTRDRDVNIDTEFKGLEQSLTRVTSMTGMLARWGPLIAAAAVAVGALVAALPAMVAIFGAPIAAALVGLDGIKKAASVLSDEFDHLRESVSGVFEQLLTPGFERLSKLFPVLVDGLSKVAEGVSEVFDSFSRSITTADALKTIADVFGRIQTIVQDFARLGGMDALVNSLLTLADAGTKAAAAISPKLVATFTLFNDQLERIAKNGDLQKAMELIGQAIVGVVFVLGELVIGALMVSAQIERILEGIAHFFSTTVPQGVAAMKTAIVSDFNSLMGFLASIPGRIVGFFLSLPGRLYAVGVAAAQGLWDGIKARYEKLKGWLQQKANEILGVFGSLWDLHSPSREFRKIGQFAGEGLALGFRDSLAGVEASATLVATGGLRAAKASTFDTNQPTDSVADRPIRMQDGTLFGWIREIAGGETELRLNKAAFYDAVGV